MIHYLLRRLLRAGILLVSVSFLSFCLFELAPGDFFTDLRLDPRISEETINELRRRHGLDGTLLVRYCRWVASILAGEWGVSIAYNSPVGPLLLSRALNTLLLTGAAMICAWFIAVPFAIWTASSGRRQRLIGHSTVAVLLSLPELLIVLILMSFAAHWGILPTGAMTSLEFGSLSFCDKLRDLAGHLAVPMTALVAGSLPTLILHTRVAVAEAKNATFVKIARANGVRGRRLLLRHVLPAASNPLITLFGLSLGTLLSSSLLVEAVAGWPGLGHLLLQSLLQRDLTVVAGAVFLSSVFLVFGNLVADLLLYAADPRVSESG